MAAAPLTSPFPPDHSQSDAKADIVSAQKFRTAVQQVEAGQGGTGYCEQDKHKIPEPEADRGEVNRKSIRAGIYGSNPLHRSREADGLATLEEIFAALLQGFRQIVASARDIRVKAVQKPIAGVILPGRGRFGVA